MQDTTVCKARRRAKIQRRAQADTRKVAAPLLHERWGRRYRRRAWRYRRRSKVDKNGNNVGAVRQIVMEIPPVEGGGTVGAMKQTRTRAPSAQWNESRWRNRRRCKADKNGATADAVKQTRKETDHRDEVGDTIGMMKKTRTEVSSTCRSRRG